MIIIEYYYYLVYGFFNVHQIFQIPAVYATFRVSFMSRVQSERRLRVIYRHIYIPRQSLTFIVKMDKFLFYIASEFDCTGRAIKQDERALLYFSATSKGLRLTKKFR